MDLVFDILSNTRRRKVLSYLRQSDGRATVQELAEEIAALENEVQVDELSREQRKRVYVSLYQTHLPKLEEAEIIDYDEEGGEIRLTDRADELNSYITQNPRSENPWRLHYFVLAVVSGLLFALAFAGVPGISLIPPVVLGTVVMAAFVISGIVHHWRHQKRQQNVDFLEHNR